MAIVFQTGVIGSAAHAYAGSRARVAGAPAGRNRRAHASFMFNAYLKVRGIGPM
jgi:hypothetical protein